ncbi:hypothetical protein [Algoriphagus sediminis]|uniref:SprT-like domain-containing protein n=1 Tax=Algoriphagus sediminis TaxID=3057113 RepID=A0ABT7YC70_9BACT|nr:hypothetical protein [Algoriphagus sediminis]MDN3204126.1 hypothetical protein [Algoriphagus sediminis]
MVLFLPSCIEEPDHPQIPEVETSQIAAVRDWFETNKTRLRLPERGSNFRTESQELILPFFEKEPDWDKFHHYYFPDGREVFETSLENATKYFPSEMSEIFVGENPADFMIQNIMFVRHETLDQFNVVIARYYPGDDESKANFDDISYNGIPVLWNGKLEIFTYDERFFVGFEVVNGQIENSYSRKIQQGDKRKSQAGMDVRCTTNYIPVYYTQCVSQKDFETYCSQEIDYYVEESNCFGSDGGRPSYTYINEGGGSGDRDPATDGGGVDSVPRDKPTLDPPTIPAPKTIINQLTNQCAADIFKDLSKGSAGLTDLTGLGSLDIFPGMLDLFEQSGKFDYRIQNSNNTGGANGFTKRVNGINVITLNNDYLKNATSLSISRTIIHETVHAYLLENTYDMHLRTDYNTFELMVRYLEKYEEDWNDTHHAAMSDFILGMAVSLYNWDKNFGPSGGSLPFDYYYKMSFGGLLNPNKTQLIDEAKPFIPAGSSWNEINQILNNEKNGSNKANGTKCN